MTDRLSWEVTNLAAFQRMTDDVERRIDDDVAEAARLVAGDAAKAARTKASSPLRRIVAAALVVEVSATTSGVGPSSSGVGRHGTPADLLFGGAEYGGGARPSTRQFGPSNASGYFLNPSAQRVAESSPRWTDAIDAAFRGWHN